MPDGAVQQHQVQLPNGLLRVTVRRANGPASAESTESTESTEWDLQRLCAFAARNNPRRGFLFVSKVLGKHWPSLPAQMQAAHAALAARLPVAAEPALFLGMAETATGLAQGVFEAYLARHGAGSAVYVQTTRYPMSGARTLDFEEWHSHAQNLSLHLPDRVDLRAAFLQARLLVLVDDELSTGNTFAALIAAYAQANPGVERACLVSLTNFMGDALQQRFKHNAACGQIDFVSLLEGSFEFERDPGFEAAAPAPAQAALGCRRRFVGDYSARLGTGSVLQLPDGLIAGLLDGLVHTPSTRLRAGAPVLVLGMGEFMHPAYCLGQALAQRGVAVRVQSTTRSPVLLGADIRCRIELPDPYGERIPNYLYNVAPADYGAVLLCCETPPSAALSDTLQRLSARLVPLRHRP